MKIRKTIKALILVFMLVIMVFTRVFLGSFLEYKKAQSASSLDFSVVHYTRSVKWYTPLNPFVSKSLKKLVQIAQNYENKGEFVKALYVYEDLRSSVYSIRSFYTPYNNYIDLADNKIAQIRTDQGLSGMMALKESPVETKNRILNDLKRDYSPSTFYSILALFGFAGWIASALCFIFFVIGSGSFNKRRAVLLGLAFFGFYITWLAGLAMA